MSITRRIARPMLAAMFIHGGLDALNVGTLVPTTIAGHRFWEETDKQARAQQLTQFLKNVSMLGGLIIAATDTGGKPSLSWRARRAASSATKSARKALPVSN